MDSIRVPSAQAKQPKRKRDDCSSGDDEDRVPSTRMRLHDGVAKKLISVVDSAGTGDLLESKEMSKDEEEVVFALLALYESAEADKIPRSPAMCHEHKVVAAPISMNGVACADTAPLYVEGNIAAEHHALVAAPHDYSDVMELVEGEDASRVHNQLIALEVLTKMRIMRELA